MNAFHNPVLYDFLRFIRGVLSYNTCFFLCAHLLEVGLYDILNSNNLPDGRNGAAYAVEYII